ncbi:hypothetical protein P9112_013395 [Eukaryota sp. TZLM1-RC]
MEKQADVTGHVTVSLGQDQMAINLILPASPTLIRAIMGINEALKVLNVSINNLESKTESINYGCFKSCSFCLSLYCPSLLTGPSFMFSNSETNKDLDHS